MKAPTWARNKKQIVIAVVALIFIAFTAPFLHLFRNSNPRTVLESEYWRLSPRRHDFQNRPSQCATLIHNPKPFPRKTCNRSSEAVEKGDFRCSDGTTVMFSQYNQDYALYKYHFQYLKRPGNYLDIATNEPTFISNSYFFDRCLGWGGICVEGNPVYYEKIYRLRSCSLLPTCVGDQDGQNVEFILHAGAGGIDSTNKNVYRFADGGAKEKKVKLRCTTVERVLNRYPSPRVIDYMSLDVEGHELPVLQGINWSSTKINVINIEVSPETRSSIREFMTNVGYKELVRFPNGQQVGSVIYGEMVFLGPGVILGKPQ